MAQLKDTIVLGSLRATDTIYSTTNQFQILKIPTSSNGTTYGVGDNGQILKSNGTSIYWANDNDTTNLTSMTGTLGVEHGGTGSATADGARTNLGLGSLAIKNALIESDIPILSIIDKTSGTLTVARGGTGATSFTANSVVISGNTTTAALTTAGTGTTGQYLISNGENNPPSWKELEIGGRNLALETATPAISPGSSEGSALAPWYELSDYGKQIITDQATFYIVSFDWELSEPAVNNSQTPFIYIQLNGSQTNPEYTQPVGDAINGHYTTTLIPTNSQRNYTGNSYFYVRVRLRYAQDGVILTVRNLKLEKGTKATDWSPAPEDLTNSAQSYTDSVVNGIKIGGRNLLLDSRRERSATVAAGGTEASFSAFSLSEYGATQIMEGAELTASFDYEVDLETTTSGAFYTRLNTTSTVPARVVSDIIAVPRGRASITFKVTAAQAQYSSDFTFRIRIALSNEGASFKIWNVKLELGNHATDWTPAPEDFIETTNGIYYGVCNTAQATQAKEATLVNGANFSLEEGAIVAIKFTYASAEATMTLNVNDTGAKNLYQYGTTTMNSGTTTTGWPANAIVMFIYDGSSWIRQYWSNTTYNLDQVISGSSNSEANLEAETSANGGVGLHRYALQMMTANQKWSAISCVSGSTAANQGAAAAKVAATANFLLNSPIVYTSTNTYVAPGSSAPMNGYTASSLNLRYSIGKTSSNVSLAFQKPVYLVGIPNNDGATFKLDSTQWWTQSLPISRDNKIYIYLGLAYSAASIYLNTYHPIYYHDGTNLRPYIPQLDSVRESIIYASYDDTQSQYITHMNYNIIYNTTTPSTRSDGTTLQTGDIWLQPI